MGFKSDLLVCASLECDSVEEIRDSMELAKKEGADIVELCIASLSNFSHIQNLFQSRILPSIVSLTSRPISPSGTFGRKCDESGLQIIKWAMEFGVEFIEIGREEYTRELMDELKNKTSRTQIIVSSYVTSDLCTTERLSDIITDMQSTGADVLKLIIDLHSIADVAPIFHMLTHCQVPLIARTMGESGLISQLLGPKYGAFLVFGTLGDKNVAGLPSLASIKHVYKLENMNVDTKIFGVVSNPVSHSKGPLLHNSAFRHTGYNGIYVPLLVDDLQEFFSVYSSSDFAGFSVGIPHKEAAVRCCDEVHPLALAIGAVNTIVRRPVDGKLIGYNTDCEASITAIEDALRKESVKSKQGSYISPLAGKLFILVGAGGAGRAIAFGARSRGARVVVFNRNFERAKALALAVSGEAVPYESLNDFRPEKGMILANASAVGMEPDIDQTPISKVALKSYELVFDAVYTPRNTRLLQEAAKAGATVVSGVEMFIRQALGQFKLFTNGLAPEEFMSKIVLEQF
ncbi:bifunctional 3-dehydroquinate dehydratase/shikimate dehydrogenase, chloroplastic [Dorcoceras hygrometricum]|uniref:Bifunctional 3-dehydroquinate dehydratase/shikimate dehydrogenase, chloroplastic n=1 Tax=Dorcoceras hygrometricum TaxID=472368 RepID=A0A2Z7BED4_9LAMI|nr:bifunctional 3-dehydroquinate dehydratase/shikimate dehydrogenase, chloroplastic [Dorcoceras hygrometricum]